MKRGSATLSPSLRRRFVMCVSIARSSASDTSLRPPPCPGRSAPARCALPHLEGGFEERRQQFELGAGEQHGVAVDGDAVGGAIDDRTGVAGQPRRSGRGQHGDGGGLRVGVARAVSASGGGAARSASLGRQHPRAQLTRAERLVTTSSAPTLNPRTASASSVRAVISRM